MAPAPGQAAPYIAALFVHPVKSARANRVESVRLAANGFEHDREWMLVDPAGHFVTQRNDPRLALLEALPDGEFLALRAPVGPGGTGGDGPRIPLTHGGERIEVGVWRSRVKAFDAGAEVARWLTSWFGRPLRLVRFDPAHQRLSNRDWTGGIRAPNFFTDGYPILVLSQASVDDLAARVGRELPLTRFRANLVLGGTDAYAEDRAAEVQIGDVVLRLGKPCTRCVITTIDPATGERGDDEPLRTLKGYRHDASLRGVTFGRNAVIVAGHAATLSVGQDVFLR
jgi:uncharacterized protein